MFVINVAVAIDGLHRMVDGSWRSSGQQQFNMRQIQYGPLERIPRVKAVVGTRCRQAGRLLEETLGADSIDRRQADQAREHRPIKGSEIDWQDGGT
jgi:hypothetical protein